MAIIINELMYSSSGGSGADFIEIRTGLSDSITNIFIDVYDKTGGGDVALDTSYSLASSPDVTMTSDGMFNYYTLSVPLGDNPRAAIALVDTSTNPDTVLGSVAWGANGSFDAVDGALAGQTLTSIGQPLSNNGTESLVADGTGGWVQATATPGTTNICFSAGTLIDTPSGPRPVESLRAGEHVCTETGAQPLAWVGLRRHGVSALFANPKLRPILIEPGALGPNRPARPLRVSRQHRLFINSQKANRLFGGPVLVPAVKLLGLPGIREEEGCTGVAYVHLLFARHELVWAEAVLSESLLLAPLSLTALEDMLPEAAFARFSETAINSPMTPVYPLVRDGKSARELVRRHLKHPDQPLQTHLSDGARPHPGAARSASAVL